VRATERLVLFPTVSYPSVLNMTSTLAILDLLGAGHVEHPCHS